MPRSLQLLKCNFVEFTDSGEGVGFGLRIIHFIQVLKRIERDLRGLLQDYSEGFHDHRPSNPP